MLKAKAKMPRKVRIATGRYAPYTPQTAREKTVKPMCYFPPGTPSMMSIMACHTDSPSETSDAPICQLVRLNRNTDYQLMKTHVLQVRLCGDSGLMSSLIPAILS